MTRPPGRVVVRYRHHGDGPPLTDVIGVLLSHDDTAVRVRSAHGDVEIPVDDVLVIKPLGPRPIRTSEIRALEYAAARAWPGQVSAEIDGWFARVGAGSTRRANSAVPLEPSASLAALPALRRWFAEHDRPLRLCVPDRLIPGLARTDEVIVMARDLTAPSAVTGIDITDDGGSTDPDETAVLDGQIIFARKRSTDGTYLGRARGAVTADSRGRQWLGITAVFVESSARRQGLATNLIGALLAWGADHGAERAYLQVAHDNWAAIDLYERLGFVEHHRYGWSADH